MAAQGKRPGAGGIVASLVRPALGTVRGARERCVGGCGVVVERLGRHAAEWPRRCVDQQAALYEDR